MMYLNVSRIEASSAHRSLRTTKVMVTVTTTTMVKVKLLDFLAIATTTMMKVMLLNVPKRIEKPAKSHS